MVHPWPSPRSRRGAAGLELIDRDPGARVVAARHDAGLAMAPAAISLVLRLHNRQGFAERGLGDAHFK
jgi:hypothetical protein